MLERVGKEFLESLIASVIRRKNVTRLTREVLRETPDEYLDALIADYLVAHKFPSAVSTEYENALTLSSGCQMVFSTRVLESEVSNGGYDQFVWNRDCRLLTLARKGYKLIQCSKAVALLGRVETVVKGLAGEIAVLKKKDTVSAFRDFQNVSKLGRFDGTHHGLIGEIRRRKVEYIRTHEHEFIDQK